MASYTINKSDGTVLTEVYDLETHGLQVYSTPRFIRSITPVGSPATSGTLELDRDMTYRFVTGFEFERIAFGNDPDNAIQYCTVTGTPTYDGGSDKTTIDFDVDQVTTPVAYRNVDSGVPVGKVHYVLPDSEIATSIELTGRGTLDYGERMLENSIHMLENFTTNDTPPNDPIIGQHWYRQLDKTMRVWDGTVFSNDVHLGDGDIVFEDPQNPNGGSNPEGSRPKLFLSGDDNVDPDVGVTLRSDTNPNAGQNTFRIIDSANTELLRVEFSGLTQTSNQVRINNNQPKLQFNELDTTDTNWELDHQGGVLTLYRANNGFTVRNEVLRVQQDERVVIGDVSTPSTEGTLTVLQTADTDLGGVAVYNTAENSYLNLYVDGTGVKTINGGQSGAELLTLNEGTGPVTLGTKTSHGKLTVKQSGDNNTSAVSIFDATQTNPINIWMNGAEARIDSHDNANGELIFNGVGTGPVAVGTLDATRARFTVQQDLMLVDNGTLASPALKIGNTDDGILREAAPESITIVVNGTRQVAFQDGIVVSSSNNVISNTAPFLRWDETDTVNQNYQAQLNNGTLTFARQNDAATVTDAVMSLNQDLSVDFTGDIDVGAGNFTILAASGNTQIAGTLGVTGATTLSSTADIIGDLDVGTGNFIVAAGTGNTTVGGTLGVTGATTLSSTADIIGDLDVGTGNFTVTAASGNTIVGGTLGVTGDATFGSSTVVVTAATGNIVSTGDISADNLTLTSAQGGNITFEDGTTQSTSAITATAILREQFANGTNGGTATNTTSGTNRLYNTLQGQTTYEGVTYITLVGGSPDNGWFTLENGTYHVHASAPALNVGAHQIALYEDIGGSPLTDNKVLEGTSELSGAGIQTRSVIEGVITVAGGPKTYEVKHFTSSTVGNTDFGQAASLNSHDEIYSVVKITKLA